jgi:hypothetical protein
MLHLWLIPALAILVIAIGVLYLVLKVAGGKGVRSEGRTLYDNPDDLPPTDD